MLIVGDGIVVGTFVVISVSIMMKAHFGVVVRTPACRELCAVLTCVYYLRYWTSYMTSWYINAHYKELYRCNLGRLKYVIVTVLEHICRYGIYTEVVDVRRRW